MGLTRTLQHNFFKQLHQPLDENKTKPLAHLKFKKVLENPLARIMSRKGQQLPLFKESDLQDNPSSETIKMNEEYDIETNDAFFGSLFEIASTIQNVKKDDEHSETSDDDQHYYHALPADKTFVEALMSPMQPQKTPNGGPW